MNFKTFKYKDSNNFGIAINKKIQIGDLKELEQYQWIKYDEDIKLNESEGFYNALAFYNIDEKYVDIIQELFRKEWENDNLIFVSQIIRNLADTFKKIKDKNDYKRYTGLLGELLFIKKCELLGFEVLDYFSYGGVDNFDFHFPNNKNIEVKYGNKESRSFSLNCKQLKELDENRSSSLAVVLTNLDSINGLNLLELFYSLKNKQHRNLQSALESIKELENTSKKIFDEFKVDIEKSDIFFIDKNYLPKIEIKQNNSLISGKFKLFITEDMAFEFEKIISELINEK